MANASKREKWYRLMQDYEQSGKSVSEWCAEFGCTYYTFKYWRYRVRIQETYKRSEAATPAGWIKASLPGVQKNNEIVIRVGGAEIAVTPGFDEHLLRELVECLS